MERVTCRVDQVELENDEGAQVEGIMVECNQCGYTVQSYGTSDRSVRRCLALLREGCPEGEENFYVDENE